jgi:hypothetical protein
MWSPTWWVIAGCLLLVLSYQLDAFEGVVRKVDDPFFTEGSSVGPDQAYETFIIR